MGKHTLSNVPGFLSRSGEIYLVDPKSLIVVPGWNERTDFTGEENLMAYIRESGLPQPLFVKKTKDNTLEVVDGERRHRAVMRLLEEGLEIKGIPVRVAPKGMNDIDLLTQAIALNGGKPLTPIEEARFFKRLFNYGVPKQEIANKCGVSLSTVRNRLELTNAVPIVQEAVINNEITIKQANKIVEKSDGKVETQVEQLEIEKAIPRTRTKKPEIVAYAENEFCESINCPRLANRNTGQVDCIYPNNVCVMTAVEVFEWFGKKGWKITKEVTV